VDSLSGVLPADHGEIQVAEALVHPAFLEILAGKLGARNVTLKSEGVMGIPCPRPDPSLVPLTNRRGPWQGRFNMAPSIVVRSSVR